MNLSLRSRKQAGVAPAVVFLIVLILVTIILLGIKGGIEFGHQIKVASEEAGLGAEQFQRFTAAAEGLGVKADVTGNALAMLARRVGDAREKGGEAAEAFDHFGISLAPGRSQIEILDQVMERMRGVTDATERAAIAEAAFGREGRDMVLLAAEGADAFKAAMQSAEVLTDAEVAKLEVADAKLSHGTVIVVVCAVIWVLSLILILNQDAVAQWLVNHRIANP